MSKITEKRNEQTRKCREFFKELTEALSETHEILPSCNHDISMYLCRKGTLEEVTYCSKPEDSFRVSDHWQWYANLMKCPDPHYIQCYSRELPRAKNREKEGYAGKPIIADCVAFFKDGIYHIVYGEYWNKKKRQWEWRDNTVEDVIAEFL